MFSANGLLLSLIGERAQRAVLDQRHFAAIVESSDDAIIAKGLDSVMTAWNSGAERLFGYTAAEAIGRPITLIIPEDRHHEIRHRHGLSLACRAIGLTSEDAPLMECRGPVRAQ